TIGLYAVQDPVLAIESVDRGEIALEHGDVAGDLGVRTDVLARGLPVEDVVSPNDHVDLPRRRGDVHADDGNVLARRVGERRGDRGAVDGVDDQRVHAFVDQRADLRRLLARVAVRRDRANERHAVLRAGGLLERDVRAPEVRAVTGERNTDLDAGRLLLVRVAGGDRSGREHSREPGDRE